MAVIDISIHKALAGLDKNQIFTIILTGIFQSTRPSRASTNVLLFIFCIALNFNPQGPRGPRPNPIETSCSQSSISIHKALAGLDVFDCYFRTVSIIISIHKALAGLDTSSVK